MLLQIDHVNYTMSIENKVTAEWLAAQESFQDYCLNEQEDAPNEWRKWIEDHPEHTTEVTEARQMLQQLFGQVSQQEITQEWDRLRNHAMASSSTRQFWNKRRLILGIAASLLLLIGVFGLSMYLQPVQMLTASTSYGETQEIAHPDGTTVYLNANSQLQYPEGFAHAKERHIKLNGHAYFDVQHDPTHPFIVQTAKGSVEVLGTSFEVVNRKVLVSVTLVEGKVKFQLPDQKQAILLQPNEQLTIKNDTLSKQRVNATELTVWRLGRMEFKDLPIADLIHQLHDNYGWIIEVRDASILTRKVTAKVVENDPEVLLEAISVLYDLKVTKIQEGHFIIE